jgi:hypothetical protein
MSRCEGPIVELRPQRVIEKAAGEHAQTNVREFVLTLWNVAAMQGKTFEAAGPVNASEKR